MAATPLLKIRETELYRPVHDWLVAQGYTVRGEVKGCDVTAVQGKDLIVIELKRGFSTDLLIQATQRQKAADAVYVALPRPEGGRHGARWRGIEHLLKRLEIGLILVTLSGRAPEVEIVFHPVPCDRRRSPKTRRSILREIAGRSGDYNLGGSAGRQLLTAYRENAIFVACCLERFGALTPRGLRALGTGPKTLSILSRNVYGWFERLDRGLYGLKPLGKTALAAYPELVAHYARVVEAAETASEG